MDTDVYWLALKRFHIHPTTCVGNIDPCERFRLSVFKIGETSELIYNAKVERYRVGIVTPGGLNPLAAVKEQGIPVEPKAVETLVQMSELTEF